MKKIITFLALTMLQVFAIGQTNSSSSVKATENGLSKNQCSVVYSAGEQGLVFRDSVLHSCSDLVIETIPPMLQAVVPVKIVLTKGTYTFKKDPSIIIPLGYTVMIEDTLTGGVFDFANTPSYTFNVTRAIKGRFLMFITKSKEPSVVAK